MSKKGNFITRLLRNTVGAYFENRQLLRLLKELPEDYLEVYEHHKNKDNKNQLIKDLLELHDLDNFAYQTFGYPLYAFSNTKYNSIMEMIPGLLNQYYEKGPTKFFLDSIVNNYLFGHVKVKQNTTNSIRAQAQYVPGYGAYELSLFKLLRMDVAMYFYKMEGESAFINYPATTRQDLLKYARHDKIN